MAHSTYSDAIWSASIRIHGLLWQPILQTPAPRLDQLHRASSISPFSSRAASYLSYMIGPTVSLSTFTTGHMMVCHYRQSQGITMSEIKHSLISRRSPSSDWQQSQAPTR